jgi:hypothetical protein
MVRWRSSKRSRAINTGFFFRSISREAHETRSSAGSTPIPRGSRGVWIVKRLARCCAPIQPPGGGHPQGHHHHQGHQPGLAGHTQHAPHAHRARLRRGHPGGPGGPRGALKQVKWGSA